MDLDGVALVAGAGSGIGREVALTLASHGATALICADIKFETAEQTAEMSKSGQGPRAAGFKAQALQVDVKDEKSVQQMVQDAHSLFGRIDYFVNTAGYGAAGQKNLSSMTLDDYRSMNEVHNIGSFLCVRTVLQTMLQQEPRSMPITGRSTKTLSRHMSRGSVVILTSLASEGAVLGVGNYIAAKHAVKGLVQTAAIENARKSIRINAVAPSYVSGPMMDKFMDDVPGLRDAMESSLALGRLADPGEVADAVAFLCSASASYINGHTLVLDGGSSLQLANTPFSD
ncbi:MAG: hypothetical protein Q9191_005467 [Dirinaria sp. TL-2023a]